ncbi:type II secretion system protein [Desulfitobacterium sp.]|uniref:type IV pilus modification PilV family protein n=1 Tax=Desulfitobacterium sp. TaxID=49981 RepID=UPI002D1B77D2|nr:type II secretion system protein [Desulfitobacterium sp.]HVJ48872.1 type II secretion system protein [Desulfitobacterium sp.]
MKHRDQGMTILEVVVAITIFLIGVGFIAQSNGVAFHYRARQEIRQQMIFYAAGQLEAAIEKIDKPTETDPPFNTFKPDVKVVNTSVDGLPLQEIEVTVSSLTYPEDDYLKVTMKTYRVWP